MPYYFLCTSLLLCILVTGAGFTLSNFKEDIHKHTIFAAKLHLKRTNPERV